MPRNKLLGEFKQFMNKKSTALAVLLFCLCEFKGRKEYRTETVQ